MASIFLKEEKIYYKIVYYTLQSNVRNRVGKLEEFMQVKNDFSERGSALKGLSYPHIFL